MNVSNVSAPLRRVRCIWGFRASRDGFKEACAGDRTPLQGSIFGLRLTSKCVVTMTVNLRAGFFLKRFYWSRQKKKDTFTVSVQWRDSSPAVHKTTGSLDERFIVSSWAGFWNSAALGRAGEGRHLPVTCRLSPLTSHFRYTRPLRSVWSVPQRLGTFITHWLWTFISQAAGKEAPDFRYENKTNTISFLNYVITPPPPFRCSLTHLLMISRNCMSIY